MKPEITVEIDLDGKATIKVSGVTGNACLLATKTLEESLGAVEKRMPTANVPQNINDHHQHAGV